MGEEIPFDTLVGRAAALAGANARLMYALVDHRRKRGLSQSDVAERLGYTTGAVEAFERYDSDPPMSEIRRYALAVGMNVRHVATPVDHMPAKEVMPV